MPALNTAIFDLDGTLIDSLNVWEKVDEAFLRGRGVPWTPDYTAAVCAMSFQEGAQYTISRYGFPDEPEALMREWTEMVAFEYAHNITLKPYAKEYLDSLRKKGIKLGVATALSEDLYMPVLKNNGIFDYFDAFASVYEVKRGKGYPDVYLLTAQRLNAVPEECIVFEDVLPGIRGIKAAGMTAVGVYDIHSAPDEKQIRLLSDQYICNFSEMMNQD